MLSNDESKALDSYLINETEEDGYSYVEEEELTDYFDNMIQENDRVFELSFKTFEISPKDWHKKEFKEIATQSTIAELIDELGEENLVSIEHLGTGEKYKEECFNGK